MTKSRRYKKKCGGQSDPSLFEKIGNTASQYAEKAKNSLSFLGNYLTGKPSPQQPQQTTYAGPQKSYFGGKRRRKFKISHKNCKGGNIVRAYNTYNDSLTMNTTPVSGYRTAMPHNWVGGRTRKNLK